MRQPTCRDVSQASTSAPDLCPRGHLVSGPSALMRSSAAVRGCHLASTHDWMRMCSKLAQDLPHMQKCLPGVVLSAVLVPQGAPDAQQRSRVWVSTGQLVRLARQGGCPEWNSKEAAPNGTTHLQQRLPGVLLSPILVPQGASSLRVICSDAQQRSCAWVPLGQLVQLGHGVEGGQVHALLGGNAHVARALAGVGEHDAACLHAHAQHQAQLRSITWSQAGSVGVACSQQVGAGQSSRDCYALQGLANTMRLASMPMPSTRPSCTATYAVRQAA